MSFGAQRLETLATTVNNPLDILMPTAAIRDYFVFIFSFSNNPSTKNPYESLYPQMKISFSILSFLLFSASLVAQKSQADQNVCSGVIDGLDTVAVVHLPVAIISNKASWNKRYWRRYYELEPKVKLVYPYAKAAGDLMKQYDAKLSKIDNERDRKSFVKEAEEEMKAQFEGDLREMTVSEGILLIKLIDRETGDTSYELIEELKGGFSAFMWQSVARLFGHNLKDKYDAEGDDIIIEEIVRQIECGEIIVTKKEVSLRSASDSK